MFHPRIAAAFTLASFLSLAGVAGVSVDALVPQQAHAQYIDDAYFYTSLAPYGHWVQSIQFGWIWYPSTVSAGWRPYTDGRWVWTDDAGWVWVSYEPYGWATYHYGRWYVDPLYGWAWVPGRVWAPAWVSWRVQSGYVGWAPLWPDYFRHRHDWDWDYYRHDNEWTRRHHHQDYDPWIFTRDRDFDSPHIERAVIRDVNERDRVFRGSREITQFDQNHPERIGKSLDRRVIEQATGRRIQPVRLETSDRPVRHDDSVRDRVAIFKPRVKERRDATPDRLGVARQASKEERDREVAAWNKVQRRSTTTQREEGAQRDTAVQGGGSARPEKARGGAAGRGERPEKAVQRGGEVRREGSVDRKTGGGPEKAVQRGGPAGRGEPATTRGREQERPSQVRDVRERPAKKEQVAPSARENKTKEATRTAPQRAAERESAQPQRGHYAPPSRQVETRPQVEKRQPQQIKPQRQPEPRQVQPQRQSQPQQMRAPRHQSQPQQIKPQRQPEPRQVQPQRQSQPQQMRAPQRHSPPPQAKPQRQPEPRQQRATETGQPQQHPQGQKAPQHGGPEEPPRP